MTIHRDFGDRTNRKHARLKYVSRSAAWIGSAPKSSSALGFKLEPARPFQFTRQGDLLGWHQQTNGNYFLGLFVENGRVKDAEELPAQDRPAASHRAVPAGSPADAVAEPAPGRTCRPEQREAIEQLLGEARRRGRTTRSAARVWPRWPARPCPPAAWRWRNPSASCRTS